MNIEPKILIWYIIEQDEIVISSGLDAMFYSLGAISWYRLEYIGEL